MLRDDLEDIHPIKDFTLLLPEIIQRSLDPYPAMEITNTITPGCTTKAQMAVTVTLLRKVLIQNGIAPCAESIHHSSRTVK